LPRLFPQIPLLGYDLATVPPFLRYRKKQLYDCLVP